MPEPTEPMTDTDPEAPLRPTVEPEPLKPDGQDTSPTVDDFLRTVGATRQEERPWPPTEATETPVAGQDGDESPQEGQDGPEETVNLSKADYDAMMDKLNAHAREELEALLGGKPEPVSAEGGSAEESADGGAAPAQPKPESKQAPAPQQFVVPDLGFKVDAEAWQEAMTDSSGEALGKLLSGGMQDAMAATAQSVFQAMPFMVYREAIKAMTSYDTVKEFIQGHPDFAQPNRHDIVMKALNEAIRDNPGKQAHELVKAMEKNLAFTMHVRGKVAEGGGARVDARPSQPGAAVPGTGTAKTPTTPPGGRKPRNRTAEALSAVQAVYPVAERTL